MTDTSRQNPFSEAAEGENVLSLRDMFRIVWSRGWVIVLAMIVAVGMAVGFSLLQTPQYEASVRILIGQDSGIAENPGAAQGLQDLTQTMAQAVRTRSMAEEVIQELELSTTPERLLSRITANQVEGTQFIRVTYRNPDRDRAQAVVNAVGDAFSERISDVSPDASAVTATVWERAAVPLQPVSPNPLRNALLALMAGTMLGVGLAFLLEYLDDSWRSPDEAEQVSGVPTFGVIPRFEASGSNKKRAKKKVKRLRSAKDDRGGY